MHLFKIVRVIELFLCVAISMFTPVLAGAAPSGPLVLYSFDEGAGSVVHDVSGNGAPLDLRIDNVANTRWLSGGGLSIDQPTVITGSVSPDKIVNAIKATNAITIEAWVKPAGKLQSGPARIASLSHGTKDRNFTLAQENASYDVRLRSTRTNDNGMPSLSSADGTLETQLTHVVYTRNSRGGAKLFINGEKTSARTVKGDLRNWSESFRFALANETSGDRPWLGKLYQVAIYDRALRATEIDGNFAQGAFGDLAADVSTDTSGTGDSGTTDAGTGTDATGGNSTTDGTGTGGTAEGGTDTGTVDTAQGIGSASLAWSAPVARSDGTPLRMGEIAGYTLYYGQSAGSYQYTVNIDDAYTTSATITGLPFDTYYFVVTANDSEGRESGYSNTAIKVVN